MDYFETTRSIYRFEGTKASFYAGKDFENNIGKGFNEGGLALRENLKFRRQKAMTALKTEKSKNRPFSLITM